MNGQEDWDTRKDSGSVSGRHEAINGEYHFVPENRHADFTDAHYEPADESTVPPRYYTPPEKTAREPRKKRTQKGSGARNAGIACLVLASAVLGGAAGSALTTRKLNERIVSLESGLSSCEEALVQKSGTASSVASASVPRSATNNLISDAPTLMSPAEIYDQAVRQAVGIRTEVTMTNFFGMTSSGAVSGSGFIISEDGYILTNYHVVESAHTANLDIKVVTYDGTEYIADIVGVEPNNDIAVLKINAQGLSAAGLGNSDELRVGDAVYAVGNPLGELDFSMSTGHVSALDRVINTQESERINMFQIDAAVNEGNSGGPVYNGMGEVVGIVTAKYSSSGVEGLGFAIPINDVKAIADDLINIGYVTGKAYMGVSFDSRYNSMYSQYYGMPLGAYVAEVTPRTAAEKAGLKSGDIITAIGGYTVESYNDIKDALRHFSSGETAVLTVYRAGDELHLSITFDEAKPDT